MHSISIKDNIDEISNLSLLRNKRLVFAMLCGTLALITDTQLEPIFSTRL